jgi:nucleotide-binding universal stress UspA family protein
MGTQWSGSAGAERVPDDGPVLVAYDGSPQAAAALRWGVHEATTAGLPLEVVIAWQRPLLVRGSSAPDPAEDYAGQLASRATATIGHVGGGRLRARQHVEEGPARSVILRRAAGARLLVMGTAGHVGRLGALLGSVSRYVVERVDTPVVLLGPAAAGYVESRVVVVARYGVGDPRAASWAVQRARSRPARTLHLLDTWSPPGLGLGLVEDTTRHLARQHAVVAHEQALEQLRRAAGDLPVSGALFEGRAADVEYAHGLPGDLLVVGAADVDQRPSLTHLRCPVAIVPTSAASVLAREDHVGSSATP